MFGCLSHMKIPSNQLTKLDDRSRQVVNLGKEPGTKGYRLLDPNTNQIYVSRDVTFEETKSWPWNESEGETKIGDSAFEIEGLEEMDEENQTRAGEQFGDNETIQGNVTPV